MSGYDEAAMCSAAVFVKELCVFLKYSPGPGISHGAVLGAWCGV